MRISISWFRPSASFARKVARGASAGLSPLARKLGKHPFPKWDVQSFFKLDEEKERFVDLLMRVEFFSCVRVLAYCCMSNHIHVFIFLEFGMFGSGKGKKAEREKEMQKAPSELAEKYPMLQKPKSPLQRYRILRKGREVLA